MKIIVCVDTKQGMMFNNRRQSQDSALRARILALVTDSTLWMSSYSSKQFVEGGKFIIDDNYSNKASKDDFCFIEDKDFKLENCEKVILYKWNRQYQADKYFDIDLKANRFKRISKKDFVGTSHEKITEEIYERK